jgi:hypothetical protein
LVGKEMFSLYDALGEEQPTILAEELSDIINEIAAEIVDGSVMMIKGSNSVKLWQLVTHLKQLAHYYDNSQPADDLDGTIDDNPQEASEHEQDS